MDIFTDRVAQGCLIGSIPKRASWRFGGIPRENFLNGIRLLGTKICKGGGGGSLCYHKQPAVESASNNYNERFKTVSIFYRTYKHTEE